MARRSFSIAIVFAITIACSRAAAHADFDILPAPSGPSQTVNTAGETFALSSIPEYDSRKGTKASIYLDFIGDTTQTWGDFSPGTTPAYDIDGDVSSFSSQELENIREIWSRVAEMYSPFDINVTTADPGDRDDYKTIRIVIGGDGKKSDGTYWPGSIAGGISYVGSFTNGSPNTSYVFSSNLAGGDAKDTAIAAAHEAGHSFGLHHQSIYDQNENLVDEYNSGNAARAPIMGNAYAAQRATWFNGPSLGATNFQNDLVIISSANNGFRYRPDDFGSTIAAAAPLTIIGSAFSAQGVIEKAIDKDFFSFETTGGLLDLIVTGPEFGGMLDATLSLYSSDGSLIRQSATENLSESFSVLLGAGIYDVAVSSAGNYGDIGQYFLSGIISPVPEPTVLAAAGLILLAHRSRHGIFFR